MNQYLIIERYVWLIYFGKYDKTLLREIGLSEGDINRLNLDFRNVLIEQHEEYLDYIKNEEESVVEKFLNE